MIHMIQDKIEVRPVTPLEKDVVELCIARSFSKDPNNPIIPDFIKIELADPNYFWGVFLDGKPTAGLKLIPFEIQIEKTIFRILGLTGVGTDPNHRHKGYASLLLQGVHKYLKERGFDGTILHSAADLLYVKNGYEFAFCEWEGQVNPKKIFDLGNVLQKKQRYTDIYPEFYIRSDITQKIIDDIFEIRNQSISFKKRPFRVNRSKDYMFKQCLRLLERSNIIMQVIYQEQEAIGYQFSENKSEKLEIIEQYCRNDEKEIHLLLWKNLIDQFDPIPKNIIIKSYFQDEVIKELIQDTGGTYYRLAIVGNMAHLFDPISILNKMMPTFNDRIKQLNDCRDLHSFILNIADKSLLFEINTLNQEPVKIENLIEYKKEHQSYPSFKIPKDEFVGLIFGYLSLDDLDLPNDFNYKMLKPILNVLFPQLEPVWDYWHKY